MVFINLRFVRQNQFHSAFEKMVFMSSCQRKKLTQYFLPVLITAYVNIVINLIELMRQQKNRSSRQ